MVLNSKLEFVRGMIQFAAFGGNIAALCLDVVSQTLYVTSNYNESVSVFKLI